MQRVASFNHEQMLPLVPADGKQHAHKVCAWGVHAYPLLIQGRNVPIRAPLQAS